MRPFPVYDVSSRSTFDELVKWFREIETYCGEGVVKMVVGNKVDKASDRAFEWFDSSPSGELALSCRVLYLETSKSGSFRGGR